MSASWSPTCARQSEGPHRESESGDRLQGCHRARRTPVQPVQLSLIPDPLPTPIPDPLPAPAVPMVEQLPADAVGAAMTLLATVIAKAAAASGARWSAMSEAKVTAAHLRRAAVVYVRQSTMAQVSRNRESTTRQYDLVARAAELGWPRAAVRVIDDDLGVSGASATGRSGFAELAAQVGLGQVGNRAGVGGVAAGPQQRRLVSAAGFGRDDRHADRRRRRDLPSGACSMTACCWA